MKEDIVITGIGIVNALGYSIDEIWNNLLGGIINYNLITNYNPNDFIPISHVTHGFEYNLNDEMNEISKNDFLNPKLTDKILSGALYVAHKAIQDANIKSKNGSVIFSSTSNNRIEYLRRSKYLLDEKNKRYNPKLVVSGEQYFYAGYIMGRYGFTGSNLSLNSACSTGLVSLDYGIKMLNDNDVDFVLVGNSETNVEPNIVHLFDCLNAISINGPCKPFDKQRSGLSVGDGAIALILEKRSSAEKRNAKIYATIKSVVSKSDEYHPTLMSKTCIGLKTAISMALIKSNISSIDIDYINAHATGTILGDEIEYSMLETLFPNNIVNSFKGYIGHLTATSGLTELVLTILSMNNSTVIKSANILNSIENNLKICSVNTQKEINYALKTSIGFGGNCSAVVIEKEK